MLVTLWKIVSILIDTLQLTTSNTFGNPKKVVGAVTLSCEDIWEKTASQEQVLPQAKSDKVYMIEE